MISDCILPMSSQHHRMILPEYGRIIHGMIDYCKTIENAEERQLCAQSIIDRMFVLNTDDISASEKNKILWDHLYIMSDFELNLEFPVPVITKEEYQALSRTSQLSHNNHKMPRYRHYGSNVERMIDIACDEVDPEVRLQLSIAIFIQMRSSYIKWNSDGVSFAKIFADLYELSDGRLYLDESICKLYIDEDLESMSILEDSKAKDKVAKKKNGVLSRKYIRRKK